jgi:O-antigen/teichoic acid export membrane protein
MTKSVQARMAHGAIWMLLFKFIERSIGLVSMLILVRFLAPSEFGIVAMAMSFLVMSELLTAFGFDITLIQRQDSTEEHYHTAWTLNALLGVAITALMLLAASPIASFYGRPEVFWVVCALALGPMISGMENIGVVAFRKDLEFRKEFLFQISRKVIGFMVVIPLALWLRNYWALVAGTLSARLSGTLFSYYAHPFRPRFSLRQVGSLFHFSKWLLLNNVVSFLKERLSDFFIGRLHGPAVLGLYNVSYEFAHLPMSEMSAPIHRALLPGFAKLVGESNALSQAYANAIRVLALVVVPAAAGIFAVAPYLVPVVLGAKWMEATPLLELLALNSVLLSFHASMCMVLIATGHPDRVTQTNGLFVVILVVALFFLAEVGATGVAYAVLLTSIASTPLYLIEVRRAIGIRIYEFALAIVRPVIGSLVMVVAVRTIVPSYSTLQTSIESILLFFAAIAVGFVTYVAAVLIMWIVLMRPYGAEQIVLERVYGLIKAKLGSSSVGA